MTTKKEILRKKLLAKLLLLTNQEIKRRSKYVEKILSELPIYRKAKCIMAFFPLKGEVNLLGMFRKDKIKQFCFPVMDIAKKGLSVFKVSDIDSDFLAGPYGVMEPDKDKTEEIKLEQIDLIIVPGLAFDANRNRLGRGAGYYDRFLSHINRSTQTTIGVGYDFQLLEDLPTHSPFDLPVDIVVTETRIVG
ncbi:MAG: 5-formyltetrahydrofolate cyclo-ligase [Candidatus Omnitrophica bacterium]|nr:5-formyltetrahydrofolate cyclo-ligase [Candidatus Omnitrophota bacterium]MDD5081652.1 5-formyltetrahydrofolate cyclo-ligase [Candidatus Omnitrophota bacterium]MDD5441368.1 5-formyltetrahydrofolate cyclo-ligase [Candidatus Omnitrophota bacterium]